MNLAAWTRELVDGLAAAGVSAAADKRDVTTPGVLIVPKSIDYPNLGGDVYTVEWDALLIASDPGTLGSLDELTDLLEKLDAVHHLGRLEAVTVALPNHNPDGLPALRTTLTTECEDSP